jgi:hypothetical protein
VGQALLLGEIVKRFLMGVFGRPSLFEASRNEARTLRILYATPWNPWTLVETLDKKRGQRVKKALIAALLSCPPK